MNKKKSEKSVAVLMSKQSMLEWRSQNQKYCPVYRGL